METENDTIIYIKISDVDIDPDKRTWYYDGQGIKRDKETNKVVVLVS